MTHFLKRTALILAGAGSLAACTTYEPFEGGAEPMRPTYPINKSASPPVAPPAKPPQDYSQARPTTPIEGRSLPPAAPSNQPAYVTPSTPPAPRGQPYAPLPPPPPYEPPPAPSYQAPRAYQTPPAPAYQPPPLPPAPPATRIVTHTSVTGKVIEVEGPRVTYTVKKGDNLDAIGRKMDLDRKDLAKLNDLKAPYRLQPGEELKGPPTKRKAYVVGSGDTLFAIAKRFSVTAKALGEENGLKTSANLRPGQKIRLPEDYKDKGPTKTKETVAVPQPAPQPPPRPTYTPAPVAPPPAPMPPPRPSYTPPSYAPTPPVAPPTPRPQPVAPTPVRPAPPPPAPTTAPSARLPAPAIIPSQPTASDAQISELGRGRFIWPVRGEILSAFGPKGTGQRNDGVNIRAAGGEPVRSAAAGDVVYAGDQVPGFGNLVLVKHADGWVTAYGHLARSDVKMQQKVTQGQQIGTVGQTGGASETQLHFEVRYAPSPADRARPIDPLLVLPK